METQDTVGYDNSKDYIDSLYKLIELGIGEPKQYGISSRLEIKPAAFQSKSDHASPYPPYRVRWSACRSWPLNVVNGGSNTRSETSFSKRLDQNFSPAESLFFPEEQTPHYSPGKGPIDKCLVQQKANLLEALI